MNSFDMIAMGFKNLWRRKFRTLLTISGVVIGVVAIIIMISMGIGINESNRESLERMGDLTRIEVNQNWDNYTGDDSQIIQITDKALEQMAALEGVKYATPMQYYSGKVVSGKYTTYANIIGVYSEALKEMVGTLQEGAFPEKNADGYYEGIFAGAEVSKYFLNMKSRDPWANYGMETAVNMMTDKLQYTFDYDYGESYADKSKQYKLFNIVCNGIMTYTGNYEPDEYIYVDLKYMNKLQEEYKKFQKTQQGSGSGSGGGDEYYYAKDAIAIGSSAGAGSSRKKEEVTYDRAYVKVENIDLVQEVCEKIKEMGFSTYSLTDTLVEMQNQTKTLRMVLGGIGIVSLIIAAIGIMNTMVMSIYERTREIGVMKVLGCKLMDIFRMFLFEAFMIGAVGGTVGVGASYAASAILNKVAGGAALFETWVSDGASKISVIPPWLAIVALAFAMCIGVLTGVYPAIRAMRISALEAIKSE